VFSITASVTAITCAALSPPVVPPPKLPPPLREFWPGPRLVLPPQSRAERPIQMQTVRIAGDVNGTSATTEIDITFFNPNHQVLEGELQFPLLDGQSIAGFAMDVNGKLRDAVPVEKAKGQAVFEDIIRRRVDPGLLEATAGNNFKLRIYPLPANGTRRVVLRVSESLAKNLYRVPLAFGDANNRVGRLDLDIRIHGVAARVFW
jgi:Ca-activated chloride channel homolog